jgi:hypothetical protein
MATPYAISLKMGTAGETQADVGLLGDRPFPGVVVAFVGHDSAI